MLKEIKIVDKRETLIFKENGLFFEVCKDDLKDKEDKELCVSISKGEDVTSDGVGVGIFIEDFKKTLKENIKYKRVHLAFGFIPCEQIVTVEDESYFKIITITVCIDGEEDSRKTKTFRLPKDEIDGIIEFCKKVLN